MSVTTAPQGLRVLLVEDNPGDAKLVELQANRIQDLDILLETASTLAEAESRLSDPGIQAILLDLGLPDSNGADSVRRMVRISGERPVIVLTGLADGQAVAQALEYGAQDYLSKDGLTPELLRKTLLYAVKIRGLLSRMVRDFHELGRLQKMKDEFLAVVSHELKTPLTPILGYLALLENHLKGRTAKEPREYLRIIIDNANRLKELIEELVDVSHLGMDAGNLRPTRMAVKPLMEAALQAVAARPETASRTITLEPLPGEDPGIYADPRLLPQALGHLLSNALKFSESGKPVTAGFRREERGGRKGTVLWVRDEGKGIPEAEQELVFDKFYQVENHIARKTSGLGLGLAAVKSVMDLHGGRAWVESVPGKGSTFLLFFPDPPESA